MSVRIPKQVLKKKEEKRVHYPAIPSIQLDSWMWTLSLRSHLLGDPLVVVHVACGDLLAARVGAWRVVDSSLTAVLHSAYDGVFFNTDRLENVSTTDEKLILRLSDNNEHSDLFAWYEISNPKQTSFAFLMIAILLTANCFSWVLFDVSYLAYSKLFLISFMCW